MAGNKRDEFSCKVKAALARRSGFLCSICRAVTVGPSAQTPVSVTNIGVAAHIAAASPGGKRYRPEMTAAQRASVDNGIWLCGHHGKIVDDDEVTWPESVLRESKRQHEEYVKENLGIPERHRIPEVSQKHMSAGIEPREYAFTTVGSLKEPYKTFLKPILEDKELADRDELGLLLCGSLPEQDLTPNAPSPWTVFVKGAWLRWYLHGQGEGFGVEQVVSPSQIYGVVPAWPDTFFEFLTAIVVSKVTFYWKRQPDGYLALSQ
jgi:hypothetical protein